LKRAVSGVMLYLSKKEPQEAVNCSADSSSSGMQKLTGKG
jgi:hypothetical protein